MAYDLADKLQSVQRRSAQLRCEAFVDYAPTVCGVRLRPITLASYNHLIAFESPFVVGGPADIEAVITFVWVHHPRFGQEAHRARRRVMRRTWRALHPRFPRLNALLLFASTLNRFRWLRRFTVPTAGARLAEATAEIRRLVHEAIHDLPLASDDDETSKRRSEMPRVAMQAQLLNTFRRALDLPYEQAESMPLKRLVQLLREQIAHATGGKGLSLMSREEAAIWREHLGRKNAKPATV